VLRQLGRSQRGRRECRCGRARRYASAPRTKHYPPALCETHKEPRKRRGARRVLTPRRAGLFLKCLAAGHSIVTACRHIGIGRATAYRYRRDDPAFAEDWNEANEIGADVLEDEAWRRAVVGTKKPIFYRGKQVGTKIVKSERMLILLLKARRPEQYR
jgi:hypothetical protein